MHAARMDERECVQGESIRRLNWGCGDWVVPGWVNCDQKDGDGIVTSDIRAGLPFERDAFDYAVSIHALPELAYPELLPALAELRRVLKEGGLLRLGLPNLAKAVEAYQRGQRDYFLVPDEEMHSIGGKLITQLVWYGYSRTLFVPEFIEELLQRVGFQHVYNVNFGETRSRYAEIVELDNREQESFFVEAVK
jgi:predicted SAM-dependent methyltransferase